MKSIIFILLFCSLAFSQIPDSLVNKSHTQTVERDSAFWTPDGKRIYLNQKVFYLPYYMFVENIYSTKKLSKSILKRTFSYYLSPTFNEKINEFGKKMYMEGYKEGMKWKGTYVEPK